MFLDGSRSKHCHGILRGLSIEYLTGVRDGARCSVSQALSADHLYISAHHIFQSPVQGGDLDSLLQRRAREGALSEEEIMLIFVQICLALQYVHAQVTGSCSLL